MHAIISLFRVGKLILRQKKFMKNQLIIWQIKDTYYKEVEHFQAYYWDFQLQTYSVGLHNVRPYDFQALFIDSLSFDNSLSAFVMNLIPLYFNWSIQLPQLLLLHVMSSISSKLGRPHKSYVINNVAPIFKLIIFCIVRIHRIYHLLSAYHNPLLLSGPESDNVSKFIPTVCVVTFLLIWFKMYEGV